MLQKDNIDNSSCYFFKTIQTLLSLPCALEVIKIDWWTLKSIWAPLQVFLYFLSFSIDSGCEYFRVTFFIWCKSTLLKPNSNVGKMPVRISFVFQKTMSDCFEKFSIPRNCTHLVCDWLSLYIKILCNTLNSVVLCLCRSHRTKCDSWPGTWSLEVTPCYISKIHFQFLQCSRVLSHDC